MKGRPGGRQRLGGMANTEQTGATSNGSRFASLLEGSRCAVDGLLLHVLRHVRILEYCLAVRHLKSAKSSAMFSVPGTHRNGATFRNVTTRSFRHDTATSDTAYEPVPRN